jgi:hypothetical protein
MKHVAALALALLIASPVFAHCDWIKGPVVLDAQAALEKGDVAPVLKWIPPNHEKEVREAFAQTLSVRKQSPEAKALADRWFFETVVRIHREFEGESFSGLKGEEYTPDPSIVMAEQALESGSLTEVEKALSAEIATGLRERFRHASHTKEHASDTANAGRQYVHEYAEFIHYVLRLHQSATGSAHAEE